jgi:hypothetical protein
MKEIKWGRVVVWIVVGTVIAVAGAVVWSVVGLLPRGFQLGGTPPREEQIAFVLGPVYNTVAALIAGLGALLGGRATARRAEGGYSLNGLFVGIGVGILGGAYSLFNRGGEFTFWPVLTAILSIGGGLLGGVLGGRKAEAEAYD